MVNGVRRSKAIKGIGTVGLLLSTSLAVGVKGASSQTAQPALNCYRLGYQAAFQSPDGRHRLAVVGETATSLARSQLVYRDLSWGASPLEVSAFDSPGADGVQALQSFGPGAITNQKVYYAISGEGLRTVDLDSASQRTYLDGQNVVFAVSSPAGEIFANVLTPSGLVVYRLNMNSTVAVQIGVAGDRLLAVDQAGFPIVLRSNATSSEISRIDGTEAGDTLTTFNGSPSGLHLESLDFSWSGKFMVVKIRGSLVVVDLETKSNFRQITWLGTNKVAFVGELLVTAFAGQLLVMNPSLNKRVAFDMSGGKFLKFLLSEGRGFKSQNSETVGIEVWEGDLEGCVRGIFEGRSVNFDRPTIAVLGDSYISGEGAGAYNERPDQAGCHQSIYAWPRQVGAFLGAEVMFFPCSGAVSEQLFRDAQEGSAAPQIKLLSDAVARGGKEPDIILVSSGGNDVGFSDIARNCLKITCSEIPLSVPRTSLAVREIRSAMPGSKVIVAPYPDVIPNFSERPIVDPVNSASFPFSQAFNFAVGVFRTGFSSVPVCQTSLIFGTYGYGVWRKPSKQYRFYLDLENFEIRVKELKESFYGIDGTVESNALRSFIESLNAAVKSGPQDQTFTRGDIGNSFCEDEPGVNGLLKLPSLVANLSDDTVTYEPEVGISEVFDASFHPNRVGHDRLAASYLPQVREALRNTYLSAPAVTERVSNFEFDARWTDGTSDLGPRSFARFAQSPFCAAGYGDNNDLGAVGDIEGKFRITKRRRLTSIRVAEWSKLAPGKEGLPVTFRQEPLPTSDQACVFTGAYVPALGSAPDSRNIATTALSGETASKSLLALRDRVQLRLIGEAGVVNWGEDDPQFGFDGRPLNGFTVQIRNSSGVVQQKAVGPNERVTSFKGLNGRYFASVIPTSSYEIGDRQPDSDWVDFRTYSGPRSVVATASNGRVSVAWQEPLYASRNPTIRYDVELKSLTRTFTFSTPDTKLNLDPTPVPNGVYVASVTAVDSNSTVSPPGISNEVLNKGAVTGDSFMPVPTLRLLDTRPTPIAAGIIQNLTVTGVGGVPENATAVALNVTAVNPLGDGHLRVFPAGTPLPNTSVLNFAGGQSTPNQVLTKVGVNGQVSIYAGNTTDVLVEILGYFIEDALKDQYTPLAVPTRLKTVTLPGAVVGNPTASTVKVQLLGQGGFPLAAARVSKAAVNVGSVNPEGAGHLRVFPTGNELPTTSTNNFAASDSRTNLVLVEPGIGGSISVYNASSNPVTITVDSVGYFSATEGFGFKPINPVRPIDTRIGAPMASADLLEVPVSGVGQVPSGGELKAVVINVAAVNPSANGGLIVVPTPSAWTFHTLKHPAGKNVANLTIVPVGSDGKIRVINDSPGTTHVIVDIVGYVTG
jgi:hypothetical protein